MFLCVCQNSEVVLNPRRSDFEYQEVNKWQKHASQENVLIIQVQKTVQSSDNDQQVCQNHVHMILAELNKAKVIFDQ